MSEREKTSEIDLESLRTQFEFDSKSIKDWESFQILKQKYLGRKSQVKSAFKSLKSLSLEKKKDLAQRLNRLNQYLNTRFSSLEEKWKKAKNTKNFQSEKIEPALPGLFHQVGASHPVTIMEEKCLETLRSIGFQFEEGPEVESPYYNFDALNIPKQHPSRDLQDTFWLQGDLLLRSHTTSVQARVLEQHRALPIKVASAGRVFRNENVDATHLALFHQLEGFWVEKGLNFTHLKGILRFMAKKIYGENQKLRFKPKYYPYTEPSIGLDIQCTSCREKGCQACHFSGWVTIMGAGMIHTNILKRFGYNQKGVRGLAFGWGTTRMALQFLSLPKAKSLYEQDLRWFKAISRRGIKNQSKDKEK